MDVSEDHMSRPLRRKRPAAFSAEMVFAPAFFGCLISLFFTMLVVGLFSGVQPPLSGGRKAENREIQLIAAEERAAKGRGGEAGNTRFFSQKKPEHKDLIQELYRQPESRERVVEFFAEICPSREIAEAILDSADAYDISPALALALGWEESQLNPQAVNAKNRDESIDRGLFQLNNRSFPRLEIHSFFDPDLNAWYGMSHLRHCLDSGGTEIAALAMYNAGTVRVRNSGAPKTTLDYISRILENRSIIEYRFEERESQFRQQIEAVLPDIAEAKPDRRRLTPLAPLQSW